MIPLVALRHPPITYILDKDTYNFDESGYLIGVVSSLIVIVPIGYKAVYVDNPTNRELVTSIEYISIGGYYVPPIIIFKGAYHLRKYFKNDIDSYIL